MAKVSKLSKMSKTICLHSLLGLLASVIISSCFYDIQNDLEQENRGHCGDDLGEFKPIHVNNLVTVLQFLFFFCLVTIQVCVIHFYQISP